MSDTDRVPRYRIHEASSSLQIFQQELAGRSCINKQLPAASKCGTKDALCAKDIVG